MNELWKSKLLTLVACFSCALTVWRMAIMLLVLLMTMLKMAIATPHYDSPLPAKASDESVETGDPSVADDSAVIKKSSGAEIDSFNNENISISKPPPMKGAVGDLVGRFNKLNYIYPYHQEVGVHAGVVFGIKDSSEDEDLMNGILGFNYLMPSRTSPKWELGADLSMVGNGHLRMSRRTIYNEKGSFRPYYELGVMHKMVPDEKFASLSNWENYLFRVGVGLSDIVRPPKSVQLELEVAVGTEDVLAFFTYGYSWGF